MPYAEPAPNASSGAGLARRAECKSQSHEQIVADISFTALGDTTIMFETETTRGRRYRELLRATRLAYRYTGKYNAVLSISIHVSDADAIFG